MMKHLLAAAKMPVDSKKPLTDSKNTTMAS
jgi:hypothetical protein